LIINPTTLDLTDQQKHGQEATTMKSSIAACNSMVNFHMTRHAQIFLDDVRKTFLDDMMYVQLLAVAHEALEHRNSKRCNCASQPKKGA